MTVRHDERCKSSRGSSEVVEVSAFDRTRDSKAATQAASLPIPRSLYEAASFSPDCPEEAAKGGEEGEQELELRNSERR